MENCLVPNCFVQPRFIEELGCEGLSLHDVAKSIGVEFKHIKEKFERMVSFGVAKGVFVPITVTNANARRVRSYALDSEAAEHFYDMWNKRAKREPENFYIVEFDSGVKVGIGRPSRVYDYMKPWCRDVVDFVVVSCANPRALETHIRRKYAINASENSPEFLVGIYYAEVFEEAKRYLDGKFSRVLG